MPDKASKLLERMRNAPASLKRRDIIALYESYGFVITSGRRSGRKHDKVYHPDFPMLITFLPRHSKLSPAYFRNAVELIEKLIALRSKEEK